MNPEIARIKKAINSTFKELMVQSLSDSSSHIRSGLSTGSVNLNYKLSGSPFIGFEYGRIVENHNLKELVGLLFLIYHQLQKRLILICIFNVIMIM